MFLVLSLFFECNQNYTTDKVTDNVDVNIDPGQSLCITLLYTTLIFNSNVSSFEIEHNSSFEMPVNPLGIIASNSVILKIQSKEPMPTNFSFSYFTNKFMTFYFITDTNVTAEFPQDIPLPINANNSLGFIYLGKKMNNNITMNVQLNKIYNYLFSIHNATDIIYRAIDKPKSILSFFSRSNLIAQVQKTAQAYVEPETSVFSSKIEIITDSTPERSYSGFLQNTPGFFTEEDFINPGQKKNSLLIIILVAVISVIVVCLFVLLIYRFYKFRL